MSIKNVKRIGRTRRGIVTADNTPQGSPRLYGAPRSKGGRNFITFSSAMFEGIEEKRLEERGLVQTERGNNTSRDAHLRF